MLDTTLTDSQHEISKDKLIEPTLELFRPSGLPNRVVDKLFITEVLESLDKLLDPKKFLNGTKFNYVNYLKELCNLFELKPCPTLIEKDISAIFGASLKNLKGEVIKPFLAQEGKAKVVFLEPASKPTLGSTNFSIEQIPREVAVMFFAATYTDLNKAISEISLKVNLDVLLNSNNSLKSNIDEKKGVINNLYFYYMK
jgi:hypothetical protein